MTSNRTQPVLLGGLFIGVLSALPVINVANCCCLWIAGGGVVTAYLVQQKEPDLTVGDGGVVGLLAGIVGAFVWAVVATPIQLVLGPLQARLIQRLLTQARDIPMPMDLWAHSLRMGALSVIQLAIGFFVMLLIGMIFSGIGGMLGVVLFRKSAPPAAPPPVPPLAPPTPPVLPEPPGA